MKRASALPAAALLAALAAAGCAREPGAPEPADSAAVRAESALALPGSPPSQLAPQRFLRGILRHDGGPWMLRECGMTRATPLRDLTGGTLPKVFRELAPGGRDSLYVELDGRHEAEATSAIRLRRAAPVGEGGGCREDPSSYVLMARGNEPFWSVVITRSGIVFQQPDAPTRLDFPYTPARPVDGTRLWAAESGGHRLRVVVRPRPCRDSMSGEYSFHSAEVELDGRALAGCAFEGAP